MLYITPTPIGNLKDITERAKDALKECDFVITENPSNTHKLFKLLGIVKKQVIQLADFNEEKAVPKIIEKLQRNSACLVSDAGTPTISDPGFKLIRECVNQNINIISLPGANAAITALAASGLPTDKFLFVGFLPKTEIKLQRVLEEAKLIDATLIAYDSPQRILKTMATIAVSFPESKVVIARELTKIHEEFIRGTSQEVLSTLTKKNSIKGEITILVSFKF